jgi:hypothetical protein
VQLSYSYHCTSPFPCTQTYLRLPSNFQRNTSLCRIQKEITHTQAGGREPVSSERRRIGKRAISSGVSYPSYSPSCPRTISTPTDRVVVMSFFHHADLLANMYFDLQSRAYLLTQIEDNLCAAPVTFLIPKPQWPTITRRILAQSLRSIPIQLASPHILSRSVLPILLDTRYIMHNPPTRVTARAPTVGLQDHNT